MQLISKYILITVIASLLPMRAFSADSRELSEHRRKQLAATSFYCPVGREPMLDSWEAWFVHPIQGCTFSGPLDTKINRLKLQAPVLNPLLTLSRLKTEVERLNLKVRFFDDQSLSFELENGAELNASLVSAKEMQDPYFHFKAIPASWGNSFISISASRAADIEAFISLAKNSPEETVFWRNPHFGDEAPAIDHLRRYVKYRPISLLSKCKEGQEWKNFGTQARSKSLLVVGDLHNPEQTAFFLHVVTTREFAWVGLELPSDFSPALENFLAATDEASEEKPLAQLNSRLPIGVAGQATSLLRFLKAKKIKIVLLDSSDAYFNFPFTNVSFHGMVMSTRNSVWAAHLPENWQGTAVMLGGLDHYLDTPGSDFQDYVTERFPEIELGLVNPYENCAP